ncbi:MAG: hypothetical protein EP330_26305 [Deltaproteobacteria bacterium]|nr:MAG: hypothetical protein EP330_26305 [Deltaproteobacteria bacterium]
MRIWLISAFLLCFCACGQIGEEPTDSGMNGQIGEEPTDTGVQPESEACTGGLDEDEDGLIDCDDPDCSGDAACG